jgi:prolipoprotein diacylglyceryltransferase
VTLYSIVRFGIEFLRGDPDRGTWFHGALSTSQIIALVLVLAAAVLYPRLSRRGPVPPAPAPKPAE